MSVREEERRKENCSSRGLGLAAAAIGVGVGAALYCFFSKGPEHPDGEGSTTQGWSCEQPQTLNNSYNSDYTTASEYSTTDTSMNDSNGCFCCNSHSEDSDSETESSESEDSVTVISDESDAQSLSSNSSTHTMDLSFDRTSFTIQSPIMVQSDSDVADWDVTNSSLGVPRDESMSTSPMQRLFGHIATLISPRKRSEEGQMTVIRDQAFRERSWSLEECAICFEVMLKDQELMSLPCTHNFHVQCIGPWLQERQTCPMCRKTAE